ALVVSKILVLLFNAMPAKWFCDYDEKPNSELYKKRLFFRTDGIAIAIILSVAFISIHYQFSKNILFFLLCCFVVAVLIMIGVADYKYTIIPDQFTLALLIIAVTITSYDLLSGNHILNSTWYSPILGGLSGAGLFLLISFVGKLFYKNEVIGFGDVKLFGVIGVFTGFAQVFILFVLTIFLAFLHIVYLFIRRKISKEVYLPLGPYICFGLFLFLTLNHQIYSFCNWYVSLLRF
ncbi:MAG: A24 family peptidase, partial [Oscillospiraceae bacterium]